MLDATRHSAGEDILDSRDLIERTEELEAQDERSEDEQEELDALLALAGEGIEDWQYGAGFIHERYFEEYAQQLAEDIGAIDRDAEWPLTYIDWEAASEALKQDYTEVDFMGHTYYAR